MKKKGLFIGGLICVFVALALFLPVMLNAGSLEPSGAPAPTMKTLDQIPPTWSEKITTGRFVDALGGEAVLDKETGLVWEKSPSIFTYTWSEAIYHCDATLHVGGRKGWRLPTIEQFASLVDVTQSNPSLPSGHPFSYVQSDLYWSASAYSTTSAWYLNFNYGSIGGNGKTALNYAWCVRGGQSSDVY